MHFNVCSTWTATFRTSTESRANSEVQVEGPRNKGVVNLHMIKGPGQNEFQYKYLFLNVKGQPRVYLENADKASSDKQSKKAVKLLGFRLSWEELMEGSILL